MRGFSGLAGVWWEDQHFVGFTSFRIARKLAVVIEKLKAWSVEANGKEIDWQNKLTQEIKDLDRKDSTSGLHETKRREGNWPSWTCLRGSSGRDCLERTF